MTHPKVKNQENSRNLNNTTSLNDDLRLQCEKHMSENQMGINIPIICDGVVHRYSADGKKNKPDEWYIAFEGLTTKGNKYLNCIYGSWSSQRKYEFKSWDDSKIFDEKERKELHESLKKKKEEIEKKFEEDRDKAENEANKLWRESSKTPPKEEFLAYSKSKGIEPIGARFGLNPSNHPSIIIPIHNVEGKIRSLQFISMSDGISFKSFLKHGEKKGNFFVIGNIMDGSHLYVTEGYATAVSIHLASKQPVVVAFDAGSLDPVIENIRKKYPNNEITIAADNDSETDGNPGKTKAEIASKKYRCNVVIPKFPDNFKLPNGKRPTDFNDLYVHFKIDEVKNQLISIPVAVSSVHEEIKKLTHSLLKKEEPCASFSTKDLPKQLHQYINSICETTDAHPIMITTSVLSSISGIIKKRLFIRDYFQTLYPNLWMISVYKSGGFKSTAMENGAKVAREISKEAIREIKILEEQIRATTDTTTKKELENRKLLASLKDVILPNKITAEALLEHLAFGHSGVILTGEFGAWLQNMDKTHNGDLKSIFTELYDIPPSYRYKTKTQGDHILENPFFSICGFSTLAWLKENLKPNDVSSGFFARFLLFSPPHQDYIPPALPRLLKNSSLQEEFKIKQTLENMDKEYEYRLSPSAKKLFESAHISLYSIPKSYSDNCQLILDPYLKRWSPYILKLSMIMRLFEDPTSKEISDSSINSAMAILLPAIKSTAYLFETELGESDQQKKNRIVLEWICNRMAKGMDPTWAALIQSKILDGGALMYDNSMKNLLESGLVKVIPKGNKKDWIYIANNEQVV